MKVKVQATFYIEIDRESFGNDPMDSEMFPEYNEVLDYLKDNYQGIENVSILVNVISSVSYKDQHEDWTFKHIQVFPWEKK